MVAAVARQLGQTDHSAHSPAPESRAIADRHRDTGCRFQQRSGLRQDLQAVCHRVVDDEDRRDLAGRKSGCRHEPPGRSAQRQRGGLKLGHKRIQRG